MKIIDDNLINGVVEQAKLSPRLRMNSVRIVEPMVLTSQKNVWHGLECLEPSVLLECKEGPFVEHEVDGILEIKK